MQGLLIVAYLTAAVFFILSLSGLSNQKTAQRGNLFGVLGMTLAILATALIPAAPGEGVQLSILLLAALFLGGGIGSRLASKVAMTAMPPSSSPQAMTSSG